MVISFKITKTYLKNIFVTCNYIKIHLTQTKHNETEHNYFEMMIWID